MTDFTFLAPDRLLALLSAHALTATALALAVALACRFVRHAAVVHALWVLVLLKLLTPPLVELAVVPRWHEAILRTSAVGQPEMVPGMMAPGMKATSAVTTTAVAASPTTAVAASPTTAVPAAFTGLPRHATAIDNSSGPHTRGLVLLALLVLGSIAVAALALFRLHRFHRQLVAATPAADWLQARTAVLAARLGLRRLPLVRVVPATLSPMLWGRPTAPTLLLPAALLDRLGSNELDAVLTHELAHLRRGDPWVRLLELTATVLFWWHPVLWWARHRLHQVEESSCDAWVAHALPGRARAYAEGLLKTLELLHGSASPLPALATGISTRNDLEKRLTMIMTERTPKLLTLWHRWTLATVAIAALLVVPTWADRRGDEAREEEERWSEDAAAEAQAEAEDEAREARFEARMKALEAEEERSHDRMRDLERQAMALAEKLQAVEAERDSLAYELDEQRSQAEAELLTAHAAELKASHRREEAEALMEEALALRQEQELRRHERALVEAEQRELRPLERKLHSMELELEELHAKEAEKAARALEVEMRRHERELEAKSQAHELRATELELAHHDQLLAQLKRELETQRREANVEEAREIEEEIERLRAHRREIEDLKAALERSER